MNESSEIDEPDANNINAIQATEVRDDNAVPANSDTSGIRFFPVAEDKLFKLYILSFGLYSIYWFYINWKLQQPLMDKKIYPLARAIFSIFFTHSLFKRINRQAIQDGQKQGFNAGIHATVFVAAIIASHFTDRFYFHIQLPRYIIDNLTVITSLLLFILSVFPLLKAQSIINRVNNDILGYLNNKYSLLNYATIIAGAFAWLMIALGLLLSFSGITIPEQAV